LILIHQISTFFKTNILEGFNDFTGSAFPHYNCTGSLRGEADHPRGMRFTVANLLELLAGGMSEKEILQDYPYLEADDIRACLEYAANLPRIARNPSPSQ
jgi:hypothetical protein